METKKINLSELENVLSPKEMKNVLGGSGNCSGLSCSTCVTCQCREGSGVQWVQCKDEKEGDGWPCDGAGYTCD